MRTERGVGLRPPMNCSVGVVSPSLPVWDRKVEAGGGCNGLFGSQDGYPSEPSDLRYREEVDGRSEMSPGWSIGESLADEDVKFKSGELGCCRDIR